MGVLLFLLIGVAAGFVATKIMKMDLSLAETVAIGVLGALVGGIALRALIAVSGAAFGFVGAVLGACALILLYQRLFRRRR
ncbi:MAG: GlsB/YeaQ/YmgE family stress response membrane protein [Pseudomonadota bacterium]